MPSTTFSQIELVMLCPCVSPGLAGSEIVELQWHAIIELHYCVPVDHSIKTTLQSIAERRHLYALFMMYTHVNIEV